MPDTSPLDSLLPLLHDQSVRDLAWAIGSPSLLDPHFSGFDGRVVGDPFCSQALGQARDWLLDLERDPSHLHAFLQAPPTRLGHYFEQLVEFWLRHTADVKLGGSHIEVRQGGVVRGEFDYLFRRADGGWRHWETAVKFYLQASPHAAWDAYVGPNARDRLDLKIRKVFERQLRLGEQPESAHALQQLGVGELKAEAFIKGYLFYPAGNQAPADLPGGISANHLRGWWLHHGSAPLLVHASGSMWCVLERLDWLSPCRLSAVQGGQALSLAAMMESMERHFAASHKPLLLAELRTNPDGSLDEISRGFVVAPSWPLPEKT
jgi:hypothetical protein